MSLIDQLIGRKPVAEDYSVPPVLAGKQQRPVPSRSQPPKEDAKIAARRAAVRRQSVLASIMGMTESEEEGIIPTDAQELDTENFGAVIPGVKKDPLPKAGGPAEPTGCQNPGQEELIQPFAALVAPDLTPNTLKPIDPSRVPQPPRPPMPQMPAAQPQQSAPLPQGSVGYAGRDVMDMLLGRQNNGPQPAPNSRPPYYQQEESIAMAESLAASMAVDESEIKAKVAASLTTADPGTCLMPNHKEGDGKTVFNSFRRFMG